MYRDLHIVSFNVPLPANYGGVIDVYYRLRALARAGVRVHLHCFTYGRSEAKELEQYCVEVHYYQRDMSPLRLLDHRPFIVASRDCSELKRRLMHDRHPILLEGLHCCALLEDDELCKERTVIVRAHNVETDYYRRLSQSEQRLCKRLYLKLDASKIAQYEPILTRATAVLAISDGDRRAFESMGCRKVLTMKPSHPHDEIVAQIGHGTYALYHGALDVAENEQAAMWLLDNIVDGTGVQLTIAGARPSRLLKNMAAQRPNICIVADPDEKEMQRLIADAQVCLLVTNQPTGLKLKLLNSLFAGRHCLVNSDMVAGTQLGKFCTVEDDAEAMRSALLHLMETPFSEAMLSERSTQLQPWLPSEAVKPLLDLLQ